MLCLLSVVLILSVIFIQSFVMLSMLSLVFAWTVLLNKVITFLLIMDDDDYEYRRLLKTEPCLLSTGVGILWFREEILVVLEVINDWHFSRSCTYIRPLTFILNWNWKVCQHVRHVFHYFNNHKALSFT